MAGQGLRRRSSRALACALGVWLAGSVALAQGKLDSVRDAVRDGDHHDDDEHDDLDDWLWNDDDDDSGLFGEALGWTVMAPFVLPRLALEDTGAPTCFAEFPFHDGPGYWRFVDPNALEAPRAWSLRPRVEFGSDFDDLERFGFGFELEHASRFGLDLAWNHFREDLDAGGSDRLDLGDLNLVYRFAQGPRTAFRAGLGLNLLDDDEGSDLGFNTTYGLEFFPARPLQAALEFDLGTLGDATQFHFRSELGFVLTRIGLFASFDYYEIDDALLRSFGLGLRGWM